MNIKYAITILLFISTCLISCGGESSNAPASEEDPKGSEIPCDEQNEGLIIKPADSETERLCKDGAWVELPSSSESVSSSSDVSSSSLEASSSSITSSSSSLDISSSSAETEGQISSSSEETKMFLCEDGVTYVLDLANCDVESSSSDALSSSSEEDSSSSLSSSSSVVSSSATLSNSSEDSSSSENVSSSSSSATSSSSERSSSSIDSSSSNVASSSSSESSSSVTSSSSVDSSSSSVIPVAAVMPNGTYDCSKYKCVTTEFLNEDLLSNNKYGEILDERDGKVYKTIKINDQIWMAQNLYYGGIEYNGVAYASKCLRNDSAMCEKYGLLYRPWNSDYPEYCPSGWRLPTEDDVEVLKSHVQSEFPNDSAAHHLKSQYGYNIGYTFVEGYFDTCATIGIDENCKPTAGLDTYGFSLAPGGNGYDDYENDGEDSFYPFFWTSSKLGSSYVYYQVVYKTSDDVGGRLRAYTTNMHHWFSVRCLKEE